MPSVIKETDMTVSSVASILKAIGAISNEDCRMYMQSLGYTLTSEEAKDLLNWIAEDNVNISERNPASIVRAVDLTPTQRPDRTVELESFLEANNPISVHVRYFGNDKFDVRLSTKPHKHAYIGISYLQLKTLVRECFGKVRFYLTDHIEPIADIGAFYHIFNTWDALAKSDKTYMFYHEFKPAVDAYLTRDALK